MGIGENPSVNVGNSWAESREWGKHRTEATEVTEGGLGDWGEKPFGDSGNFWARITRMEKASHRGHGGHRGGWGLVKTLR
jgi:hypothetical protein